jgi:hypothetical protein
MFNNTIDKIFSLVYSPKNLDRIEKSVIAIAVFSFLFHIMLIILNRFDINMLSFVESKNILSALSTPFTIILFYEIFLVIIAIAVSIPESVGKQYQAISLIVMRNMFKDIAYLGNSALVVFSVSEFLPVISDMVTTVILFGMVIIFYQVKAKLRHNRDDCDQPSIYLGLKKFISLTTLVIAIVIAIYYFGFAYNINIGFENNILLLLNTFFILLIIIDVFLLIVSSLFHDNYEVLIRNGGLIMSSILIRLVITIDRPYNNIFAIGGMLFGVLVYMIYYWSFNHLNHEEEYLPKKLTNVERTN